MQSKVVQSGTRLAAVPRKASPLEPIIRELQRISSCAKQTERDFAKDLGKTDPRFRESARNLLHYLALRQFDMRSLQARLAALGLSSLGRCERHVMASLQAVLQVLQRLSNGTRTEFSTRNQAFTTTRQSLETHAADILGAKPAGRTARIMVTLPPEAATDPALVRKFVSSGMNVARINCGHDDEAAWSAMIRNVREASAASGSECKIVMDLAGPRLRTGALAPGPKVLRLQPRRDPLGRVIAPRRLRLVTASSDLENKGVEIPVSDKRIAKAKPGDYFRFRDTRGKKRKLRVAGKDKYGLQVECYKPAYIETGTRLTLNRHDKGESVSVRVAELPAREQPILLRAGDRLILHRGTAPGQPAVVDAKGIVREPAHISCNLPDVFRFVRVGASVFLNDGKIEGIVQSVSENRIAIRIRRAKASGSKLRGNRGINFPDSELRLKRLTDKDRQDLRFIAANADAVALSFVREPEDIFAFRAELQKYPDAHPGLILKIETEQGFNNLARLLLAAMRGYPVGTMIARGDLAVECGWERLAEIQEEILWLCEAAHVPVIWATQVLEGETKKGRPSRAEISDAAMSQRADCVMLNKGPHIVEAIQMLDNILGRMQHHQSKKTATLRKLAIADILNER